MQSYNLLRSDLPWQAELRETARNDNSTLQGRFYLPREITVLEIVISADFWRISGIIFDEISHRKCGFGGSNSHDKKYLSELIMGNGT